MLFAVIGSSAGKIRDEIMAIYPCRKVFMDQFVARVALCSMSSHVPPQPCAAANWVSLARPASVTTAPGATMLEVIRVSFSSRARDTARLWRAARDAL
jgi:hypothetical protein